MRGAGRAVRIAVVVSVVGVVTLGFVAAAVATDASSDLRAQLEADVASNPEIPGESLAMRAPGVRIALATGVADRASGAPLRPDTPFRVASVTKTFVAAATLRLVEEGKIKLDDPLAKHVSAESLQVLRADGYDVERITVRQLLQHTSGLYDYALDPEYTAAVAADAGHRWTRLEQLQFAASHGDPLGEPGAVYGYADTNYILLGEILERATGKTLPNAVRSLIDFEALGLQHTYWELLEPAPRDGKERAHQYLGSFDNIALDGSSDLYGGGGLVSTVDDLVRFYRGLFHGKVFDRRSTLRTMTTVSSPGREDKAAMGIYEVDAAGERCYGHRGFWGTQAIHCPRLDLTFARTLNQALDEGFDSNALEGVIVRVAA